MAESNVKVSKDIHNDKTTEEEKLVRKTEDSKETNNDSTISLKSFIMVDDDKHIRKDQSKIDNDVKTNKNQNNSEDIQEEVSAPKCCNCIYEVSEFLPWFCINIGRWCSNSFKRHCCCNKKVKKKEKRRGALYEEDEEYWDGDVINEGDLTRYSLPVCVDDGDEDNSIKIRFHRNEGFDAGDDIKIENVDFKKTDNENKLDIHNNKTSEQDTKTVTYSENNRSNSQGSCDVPSNLQGNVNHENKRANGWSKENYQDTKTVTHHNNYHKHSDVPTSSDGVSSNDHYNYFYKHEEDIHTSSPSDHDTNTVTSDHNLHSYVHGHSDVHSSSHDFTSDSHVSHDNTCSYTDTGYSGGDTGYSGGDTGGCDTGGFD